MARQLVTIPNSRKLSPDEMREGAELVDVVARRPRLRGECKAGTDACRPCPFVSCRYHLAIDVTASGSLKHYRAAVPVDLREETCALDVADDGQTTLQRIADLLGLTRQRIEQIEIRGLATLKKDLVAAGFAITDLPDGAEG